MKKFILAAAMSAVILPAVPAAAQSRGDREYQRDVNQAERERQRNLRNADDRKDVRRANKEYRRDVRQANRDWRQYRNYDYNRYERGQTRYYADQYYRDGRYYQPRRLGMNDRIYRGQNGQYYCRRTDGTTGLIIGGIAGGLLGNTIGRGSSNTIAAILGAAGGALAGRAIDRNNVRCR